jgi:hypothetical protein
MFRTGSMTLPWGEDYTWQSPVGTQQMTTILLDLFRAGIRNSKDPQTRQMMFYAMAHAPGTTPTMWRRSFYNYLSHGMTRLDLYELRPCTASYTENYVDAGWGMYGAIRTALAELATFEDIIVASPDGVTSGSVGLWCSDAEDIWVEVTEPSLYVSMLFFVCLQSFVCLFVCLFVCFTFLGRAFTCVDQERRAKVPLPTQ